MRHVESVKFRWVRAALALVLVGFLCPAWAQKVKDAKQNLDALTFVRPQLRLSETLSEAEAITNRIENISDIDRFKSEYGTAWHFLMDERTARVNLVEGGAIPFIPGPANTLRWEEFAGANCKSAKCIPLSQLEGLARSFLAKHESIFKVPQDELVLDPVGSAPVGDSIYYLRFQWVYGGVPVEGASIFFAINNGNLIQVGATKFGDIKLYTVPTLSAATAWQIVDSYVGGMDKSDEIANAGSLVIMPLTPRGMDPETFNVGFGQMMDYALVYKLAFRRPGAMGTWEALVDAHTGEIIRFVDSNAYGHVQGGVYKTDKPQTEVISPFPFADYGASSFCDAAGNFTGTSGTSTMNGRTGSTGNVGGVYITDVCGSISLGANASGLVDFGSGAGTDCTTPGAGGAGNTHASRTQYWNVTEIKMKAYSYLPTNTWLQGHLQDQVNENQTCNAYWDGTKLNFFKSGGGCNNTGELPGVSLHEWGHGMDQNDGSCSSCGDDNTPVESRADWTALLQTHQSCTGSGFFNSGNCYGYGDPCVSCSGIRDADYAMHSHPTPWTPQNNGLSDPGYSCSSGGYNGPCGWEDHCESGIATQARWDFVNRDLVAAPTSLDLVTAWQIADRLFYTSMPQATAMYTCSGSGTKTSNGCGAGSIYTTYRAIDDDGDGVANGTPHAAAIFSSLNRHGIACGAAADAANQNETSCPSLSTPTLTGGSNNAQNVLNWTGGGANATRTFIFRNETGCGAGFTWIATVNAPALTYTDSACYNGVTYYYRIQAATSNDSCASVMSNCVTLTPPGLAFVSDSFTDSCSSGGPGSGDGVIDPGENITLDVVLKSTVSQTMTGMSATLSSTTAGVTVTTPVASYADLAAGASESSNAPHFAFSVDQGMACGTALNFNLHVTAAGGIGPWDVPIALVVGVVTTGTTQTLFSENFSSAAPPALPSGWTTSHTSGNPWTTTPKACTGNGLSYMTNVSQAADSWVFSPGLGLQAGVTYTLAFNQKVGNAARAESLEARAGASATAGGQTMLIWSGGSLTNTACAQRTGTFTAPSTGTFYLGFHCTSPVTGTILVVDDVSLTYVRAASCATHVCQSGGCTAPGTPGAPSFTGVTCSSMTVNWSAVSGATGYDVYRQTGTSCAGAAKVNVVPVTGTSYPDGGLAGNQPYSYYIVALNNCGPSGNGACASQTTLACCPAPAVTGVNPPSGVVAGGTSVIITGTNFSGVTGVKFGTAAAASYTVNSATQITATSPAHAAGAVDVTVTTGCGTSATTSADLFTYGGSCTVPSVTALSPTSGPASGGTIVTVTGKNFTGATAVKFGTTTASSFTVKSATQITVTSPAHAIGLVDVTVTTPCGTSAATTGDKYTYRQR